MEKYIIVKELPDAAVGTEVIWDESQNAFYYEKKCWVSPYKRNHLSAGQVTQNPEYFCKAQEYPEYYAYKFPVYSREEIIKLLKDAFPNRSMSGEYNSNISVSKEIRIFEELLRKLGKSNAERIMGIH
jgi:hypothetical protein